MLTFHFCFRRTRLPLLGSSKNGECSEIVPGIVAYSFKITARDELASELGIQVSDKGGRALFGKSPAQFNALTLSGQNDASESLRVCPWPRR